MKSIFLLTVISISASMVTAQNDCEVASPNEVTQGLNNFYEKLAPRLIKQVGWDSNSIFSIFSIYVAFLLLLPASAGSTMEQIANMLGFPIDDSQRYETFQNGWSDIIKSLPVSQLDYEFIIGDSLYPSVDFPVWSNYTQLLKRLYDANCTNQDYQNNAEQATANINNDVNWNTRGLIPKLFDSLNPNTVFVVINVIYFKSSWVSQFFFEYNTKPGDFQTASNGTVQVQMMNNQKIIPYYEDSYVQATPLPFEDSNSTMICVRPKSNCANYTRFLKMINISYALKILDNSKSTYCNLTIPRFHTKYNQKINDPLGESFSLSDVFGNNARFDNGVKQSSQPMTLDVVQHVADIQCDENGVVAAAATGGGVSTTSVIEPPPEIIQLIFDIPFSCFIVNKFYKLVTFQANIADPSNL